jgi:Protein of unknown function (DUF664)
VVTGGLSGYDVRRPIVPTGTNLLWRVKHVASVELGYFGDRFGRVVAVGPEVARCGHEPALPVGVGDRRLGRNEAPEAEAETVGLVDTEIVEQADDVTCEVGQRDRTIAGGGVSVALEVDVDHLVFLASRGIIAPRHVSALSTPLWTRPLLGPVLDLVLEVDAVDGRARAGHRVPLPWWSNCKFGGPARRRCGSLADVGVRQIGRPGGPFVDGAEAADVSPTALGLTEGAAERRLLDVRQRVLGAGSTHGHPNAGAAPNTLR